MRFQLPRIFSALALLLEPIFSQFNLYPNGFATAAGGTMQNSALTTVQTLLGRDFRPRAPELSVTRKK